MFTTSTLRLGALELRFNLIIAVAVVGAVAGLVRLGIWQLDRAELKLATQQAFERRQAAFPTAIEQLRMDDSEELKHLKIALAGSYRNAENILIGNRVYHGKFGYEVITPFELASNGQLVFVSRGWVQGLPDRELLPDIETVEGVQLLRGHVHVPPPQSFYRASPLDGSWPKVVSYFEVGAAADFYQREAFPYLVRLDENTPGVLTRPWPIPKLKASKSQSYAVQWFAMALAVVLVTIYLATNIRELWR